LISKGKMQPLLGSKRVKVKKKKKNGAERTVTMKDTTTRSEISKKGVEKKGKKTKANVILYPVFPERNGQKKSFQKRKKRDQKKPRCWGQKKEIGKMIAGPRKHMDRSSVFAYEAGPKI